MTIKGSPQLFDLQQPPLSYCPFIHPVKKALIELSFDPSKDEGSIRWQQIARSL